MNNHLFVVFATVWSKLSEVRNGLWWPGNYVEISESDLMPFGEFDMDIFKSPNEFLIMICKEFVNYYHCQVYINDHHVDDWPPDFELSKVHILVEDCEDE